MGKVPPEAVPQIQKEGIIVQDEGLRGSVTFRNFRAPGKRYSWRRNGFSGSIVLTHDHFLAFQFSKPIIGVAWHDDKVKALQCTLKNENTLCVGFDAAVFHDSWSGDIEVRFSTPLARTFLETIERKRSRRA